MNTTQRLLFSGLAVAALLTAGWLGFQEPTNLASNDLSNDQITANTTQGLVRSQDVIDAKIRRKEMKLNGEKSDTPRNPEARARWEVTQRLSEDGTIPDGALMRAKDQFDQLAKNYIPISDKDNGIQSWDWLGPGNVGGRIRGIAIHPTNTNTMWIGGVAGGIWKTTDGGGNWTPMTDFIANLAVTFIVLDPTDSNTLYASTGEGFNNFDQLRGAGIFKSTDGGTTWTQLAATDNSNFYWVNRLAHHPTDADHLFAATSGALYESTDGGASWNAILTPVGRCLDVRIHPADANLMLVGTSSNAYFSDDAGANWTRITDGLNSTLLSPGRCEVAFAASDTDYMYLGVNTNKGEIWRSTDGGATWTRRSTGTNYMSTQGWYDNTIWVAPDNKEFVIVGGINLFRSTDGGSSLTKISRWQNYHTGPFSPHADQHIVIPHPNYGNGGNTTVFVGNDGGIQTTADITTVAETTGWTNLANNLGITQFHGGAAAPDGSIIVGGAQDNDQLRYRPGDGAQAWYQAETGDGGFAAVNYDDPSIVYGEYVYLDIERSTDGGNSYSNMVSGLSDAGDDDKALFIAPFTMDPNDPTILYGGGASIWQTTDSANNWSQFKTPESGSLCSAIDVSATDSDVVWVGYDTGRVLMTDDGGTSWTRVDNNASSIPSRYITDIAISPMNANQVVVTTGSYSTNTVWYTDDAGASWSQISGTAPNDLPAIQVNTVEWDPIQANWLFIGTDLGVLASSDLGQNWSVTALMGDNEGPVNTRVNDLFWQGSNLIAATHGRGMYLTDPFRNNPPVAVCQDIEVDADDDCLGTATAEMVDGGSYDPDGDDMTFEISPAGPYALGANNVTLTVTDSFGESDECDAVITVIDVTPPVVTCPADIQIECTAPGGLPANDPQLTDFFAAFMAEDNCDPDPTIANDAPAFFAGPCDVSSGVTTVTWTATDDAGNAAQCTANVTVVDTTPPEIEVTVVPQVIWPPNHKMVDVEYTVTVTDICDDSPMWELVSLTSNEPEDDLGDGTTEPDIMGDDIGTADTSVRLRAERQGVGTGRIYTATFTATDCSGNSATTQSNVYVPHSKSDIGTILSSLGSSERVASDEVSLMISGKSLWRKETPAEFIGGNEDPGHMSVMRPLSAVITNTAGQVPTSAFYVNDADNDDHPDVLVAFDRDAITSLAEVSTDLDGEPVMVLEVGPEKFLVLEMRYILEVDLDIAGIIGKLRAGEGEDDDRALDRDTDVVAARATGITSTAPNPFNPQTTVSFYVPEAGHVELAVFDISGRMINRLVNESVGAGDHSVAWTGVDSRGSRVASGVYFFRMRSGEVIDTKRVMMVK